MTEMRKRFAWDLITLYHNHFSEYHNKKEQNAFIGFTLYLGGATALVINGSDLLNNFKHNCVLSITLLVTAFSAVYFVRWQFKNRRFASDVVTACQNLFIQWLEKDGEEIEIIKDQDPFQGITPSGGNWPKVLVTEIRGVRKARKYFEGSRIIEVLIYFNMVLWSIGVLYSLYL